MNNFAPLPGERHGYAQRTPAERMAVFDALPKAIRQAVAHASGDYEVRGIRKAWGAARARGAKAKQFAQLIRALDDKHRGEREAAAWAAASVQPEGI